jgi:hypothetical protein
LDFRWNKFIEGNKMKLLSEPSSNPKIDKNFIKAGVLTAPLHLAPYDLSGYQVCPMASKGCAEACLNTAGRGGIYKKGETSNRIQDARVRKTKLYFSHREEFLQQLVKDIKALERKAQRASISKVGVRLNATSDIPWERVPVTIDGTKYNNIMEAFPNVQFYDYTKRFNRKNLPKNYHLTFSLAEDNDEEAIKAYENGMNIAVVFKEVPSDFKLGTKKVTVIDGDEHDYRPIDPKGVIVGLKAKGKAIKDESGFVR